MFDSLKISTCLCQSNWERQNKYFEICPFFCKLGMMSAAYPVSSELRNWFCSANSSRRAELAAGVLGAAGPSSVWAPGALPALALVSLSLKTQGGSVASRPQQPPSVPSAPSQLYKAPPRSTHPQQNPTSDAYGKGKLIFFFLKMSYSIQFWFSLCLFASDGVVKGKEIPNHSNHRGSAEQLPCSFPLQARRRIAQI